MQAARMGAKCFARERELITHFMMYKLREIQHGGGFNTCLSLFLINPDGYRFVDCCGLNVMILHNYDAGNLQSPEYPTTW